jgi:hypothetical protein
MAHVACTWCGVHLKNKVSLARHHRKSIQGLLLRCKMIPGSTRKRPTGRFLDPRNDHFETPLWAWKELFVALPLLKRKCLWDPFFCKGATSAYWKELGVPDYVHSKGDFFTQLAKTSFDVVVTNPPFSTKQLILDVLVGCGKPFVVLLRTSVLFTKWFRTLVPVFSLVLPSKQVDFTGRRGQRLSFDCVFVCVGFKVKSALFACPRTD